MKKLTIVILLFSVTSCSKKYCDFVDNNKDSLNELIELISENPKEFFNNHTEPRTYYTYNYAKDYKEFNKTIDLETYKSLSILFNKLSIKEILIYDNQNILFKVNDADFFVSDLEFYLGHLKQKSINEIDEHLDIIEFEKCQSNWYYILERNSIAN